MSELRDATMTVVMSSMKSSSAQRELFAGSPLPNGFDYQTGFLTPAEDGWLPIFAPSPIPFRPG